MEPLMDVLDLGHSRYLVKPYELSELAAAIDAAWLKDCGTASVRSGPSTTFRSASSRPNACGVRSKRRWEDHPPQSSRGSDSSAARRAQVDGGRRAIGWIGHQPQLYGQLTVRENLRFWASLYDVPESEFLLRKDSLLVSSRSAGS